MLHCKPVLSTHLTPTELKYVINHTYSVKFAKNDFSVKLSMMRVTKSKSNGYQTSHVVCAKQPVNQSISNLSHDLRKNLAFSNLHERNRFATARNQVNQEISIWQHS